MIMAVISQGPSNAASKPAASTSLKPTTVKTNGKNKKSVVNDDADEDDVSDEEMNSDKQSDSSDYEVLYLSATFGYFEVIKCEAF